jgi:hypothetical protein
MSITPNGHQDGSPPRRYRFDDRVSTAVQTSASALSLSSNHSGRRLVLMAGLTILLLWGLLYVIFRDWRARYRARASFGATQVAPLIDALADAVPPGVDPGDWREAVAETHAMLRTVTASNLLDLQQMQSLRTELEQTVARARAHPETARDEMAGVWNMMDDRAAFVFRDGRSASGERHPRPKILLPRPEQGRTRRPGMFPRQGSRSGWKA